MTAKMISDNEVSGTPKKPKTPLATSVDALQKLRVVVRAAQRHSGWIEKQCGVTGAQLWLMQELYETPGLRVGELAERLGIHQTTTSNMLNGLVRRKLLVKKRDSPDQRVVTLALTKAGMAVVDKAPKPARGLLAEAVRSMDQKKLRDLTRGLQALLEAIGNTDEALGKQPFPFMM
jgi:DNA-binding MarR family transcriptional regulator